LHGNYLGKDGYVRSPDFPRKVPRYFISVAFEDDNEMSVTVKRSHYIYILKTNGEMVS